MAKSNSKNLVPKPTGVYIGRAACGCCLALVNDYTDTGRRDLIRLTKESVKGFMDEGLKVSAVAWQTYVDQVSQEPTFMNCPHEGGEQDALDEAQLPLFAASAPGLAVAAG